MTDFKDRLKEMRKNSETSQKKLGEYLGVTQNAIFNWESGKTEPSLEMIEKIAKYFNVSPAYLMGWDIRDINIDFEIEEIIEELSKENLEQEQVILLTRKIETLINEQKQIENSIKQINAKSEPMTITAHFDGNEYTDEELEEIRKFAEFIKSKRKDTE